MNWVRDSGTWVIKQSRRVSANHNTRALGLINTIIDKFTTRLLVQAETYSPSWTCLMVRRRMCVLSARCVTKTYHYGTPSLTKALSLFVHFIVREGTSIASAAPLGGGPIHASGGPVGSCSVLRMDRTRRVVLVPVTYPCDYTRYV